MTIELTDEQRSLLILALGMAAMVAMQHNRELVPSILRLLHTVSPDCRFAIPPDPADEHTPR